jgi:hypothetical protein
MGLDDHHWCSKCGKDLDKRNDEYVEMNFNNWKALHIKYAVVHIPDKKEVHTTVSHKESEHFIEAIPASELEDKDPKNYEIKTKAFKMKKDNITDLLHKHDRVFLCKEHYIELMLEQVEHLRECGNPIFHCSVICWAWKECSYYEPPETPPIPCTTTPCEAVNAGEPEHYQEPNCRHICVAEDVVYCRRRHPGALVLTVEDPVIQSRRMKEAPIYMREVLDKFMKQICNAENRKAYLDALPPGPLRDQEALKFDASMNMIKQAIMMQVKEVEEDPASPYFKTQTGDHLTYVEICEEKVLVTDPDKKKNTSDDKSEPTPYYDEKNGFA